MGQGLLEIPGGLLEQIAGQVGTPAYVYFAEAIRSQLSRLSAALGDIPHRTHYSVKANSNIAVLSLMRELGVGADIVSVGELRRVVAAGVVAKDIVFSGVGKTEHELFEAVKVGVGLINLESEEEFHTLNKIAAESPRDIRVGIRVNPDVTTTTHPYTQTGAAGMKFGVEVDDVVGLAEKVSRARRVKLTSIGMHLGSQIDTPDPFRAGAAKLEMLVRQLRSAGITTLNSVDVGGGLAIPSGGRAGLDIEDFVEAVSGVATNTGLLLLVEPGRYLVGNAGVLITRVLYCKRSAGRHFAIVDAGMNDFIRPSYYGAEHDIRVVGAGATDDRAAAHSVDVVGPICETGDYIGLERQLPGLASGALLAVHGAGAYGFSMSSTYNSRPRAAEVMVDGDRFGVIREREAIENLWSGESSEPSWTGIA